MQNLVIIGNFLLVPISFSFLQLVAGARSAKAPPENPKRNLPRSSIHSPGISYFNEHQNFHIHPLPAGGDDEGEAGHEGEGKQHHRPLPAK